MSMTDEVTESAGRTDTTGEADLQDRNPAIPVLAREITDATYEHKRGESENAANLTVLPSGIEVNRVHFQGILTNVKIHGQRITAKIYDGSDFYFINAPEFVDETARGVLNELSDKTPARLSVIGKPDHYETNGGEQRVSIRPENIALTEQVDRRKWIDEVAIATFARIERFEKAQNGEIPMPNAVQIAQEQYDPDLELYRQTVHDILQSTLGDQD